ncbi:hypothetical protein [Maritalea porphyrae]|jgi:hypothetical protein|uniref:hypothetical protein n=1 Tax=Maritalea porphyrae TaxID=880732 RepID=UPI0022AF2766|nr:hypothetical protein [Maritalea porphyrae]MCZ4271056.1 hypothetical protein [Maritalea porphyrae]
MLLFIRTANKWLLSAAILSFAATALHLIVGTPELMQPIYTSNTPAVSKATAQVMWNGIALLCVVSGGVLLYASIKPKIAVEISAAVILIFVGMTALFVLTGLSQFGEISSLPQWQFFGLLPLLTIIGLVRNRARGA